MNIRYLEDKTMGLLDNYILNPVPDPKSWDDSYTDSYFSSIVRMSSIQETEFIREAYNAMWGTSSVAITAGRQCGKSTYIAALALAAIIDVNERQNTTAIVTNNSGQAREMRRRILDVASESGISLDYTPGSKILSFNGTGSRIRLGSSSVDFCGDSINHLILDEWYCFCSSRAINIEQSLIPVVASGRRGTILYIGTPSGDNIVNINNVDRVFNYGGGPYAQRTRTYAPPGVYRRELDI